MTDIPELIARVEAATSPDRALDVAIAVVVDWRWPDWEEGEATARGQAEKHGLDWLVGRAINGMASMWRHMPRYTASVDDALMLAPEGQIRHIEWLADGTAAALRARDSGSHSKSENGEAG